MWKGEGGGREQEKLLVLGGEKAISFLELYYLFRILELITLFNCVINKFLLNIRPVESDVVLCL